MTEPHKRTAEEQDEIAVHSIELDTEDGGTVTIEQQNVGARNQLGGGEFKNADDQKTSGEAALEQLELQEEAPIDPADSEGYSSP